MTDAERVAYLGPAGTFTEQAVRTLCSAGFIEVPVATIGDAIAALRTGAADSAIVPLENSVEGSVGATLDELAQCTDVHIVREVVLPVVFGIFARPMVDRTQVHTVASHPHAEAQCRGWLRQNLPEAEFVRTASTADAAAGVARGEYDAALCAPVAGQRYSLTQLSPDGADISDHPGATTRFVQITPKGTVPARTGNDITSVILTLDDRPGSLAEALTQFSIRNVNLTRIESRPTKQRLGKYVFFVDCEGHLDDPPVREAVEGLRKSCPCVGILGTYQRWLT